MAFLPPFPLGRKGLSLHARSLQTHRPRTCAAKCGYRIIAGMAEKYGDRRGASIPTVADTIQKFNRTFGRPVPIVYRSIVNEMLTTSHLAIYCAMWRYDVIFAAGFDHVFDEFLKYYPDQEERAKLNSAIASALTLDSKTLSTDASAVREWCEGKKEEDVFTALNDEAQSGSVVQALRDVKNAATYDWYYSRLFGIGLINMMQLVGAELSVASAENWADKLGMERTKLASEMGNYISSMERLKQAEQIYAEAAAREAKKTAERLSARAEEAAKKLEELEKKEAEGSGDASSSPESQPSAVASMSEDAQST